MLIWTVHSLLHMMFCSVRRLQWAKGQPDGAYGGEDCGDLHSVTNFTGLNDYNCLARSRWICEKKSTVA